MPHETATLPGQEALSEMDDPDLFRSIFSRISKGIAIYQVIGDGDDVVFVDMNPAGCRLTQVSRERIRGRSVREVFPGVESMGLYAVFLEVWRTGRHKNHPVARYQDERLESWFENEVFRLPSGEIVAVFEDATERHRAAETLQRSEQRLQLAQRTGRLGFLDWDLISNTVLWSEEVCRLYGRPTCERVQTLESTLALVHPEDRQAVEEAWWVAARGGPSYDIVHRMLRPDGKTVWVHGQSLLEVDAAGAPRRLLGTVVDITELQEANESLRRLNEELEVRVAERTARLEKTNRELERFAHAVAHDLKAPLRTIQGFSDIILESHREELSDRAARYFGHIVASAHEMRQLVDDLLEYSKIGRSPAKFRPVSLRKAVERAWHRVRTRRGAANATLTIRGDLPVVAADPRLLDQILGALLDNAITFHAPTVAPRVEIAAGETEEGVYLEVRDNGIGIDPKFHALIFDIFQRLHPKDVYAGSGLGLALVKKCAGLMHAKITVESEPGAGSTFRLQFGRMAPVSQLE